MQEIKKLGVLSVANIQALISVVIGLVVGVFYALIFSAGGAMSWPGFSGATVGGIFLITTPIAYGIFGWIGGAIGALLYNLIAKWVGGIKIELK